MCGGEKIRYVQCYVYSYSYIASYTITYLWFLHAALINAMINELHASIGNLNPRRHACSLDKSHAEDETGINKSDQEVLYDISNLWNFKKDFKISKSICKYIYLLNTVFKLKICLEIMHAARCRQNNFNDHLATLQL